MFILGVNFHVSVERVPAEFGKQARHTFAEELEERSKLHTLNKVATRMLATCLEAIALEVKEEADSIVGKLKSTASSFYTAGLEAASNLKQRIMPVQAYPIISGEAVSAQAS